MTASADPLATVAVEVADLLFRIDHVLVHYGICTDYPEHLRVLEGLRDFAALPGTIFTHIQDVDPATLAGTIGPASGLGEAYQGFAGRLEAVVGGLYWGGPAREAFDGYWGPLVGYLDSGRSGRASMVDTVTVTAGYGEGVVAWWQGIRAAVVRFFRAALENGIAVALAGVDTGAPLDVAAQVGLPSPEPPSKSPSELPSELPEIEGFERVSLAAAHGADLFLAAVGGAVRREPGAVPPGELAYQGGSGPVVAVSGRSWVRVGEQDTVDG